MRYKMFITSSILIFMVISGCSILDRMTYHPDINQGNYLTISDVTKLRIGMTKQQVVHTLGTPRIKDPLLGKKIWYYVFRQQYGHRITSQRTLILTFNDNNVLVNIDNRLNSSKNCANH